AGSSSIGRWWRSGKPSRPPSAQKQRSSWPTSSCGLGRLVNEPRTLLDALLGLDYAPRYLLGALDKAFEVDR
ncbi:MULTISPECIES: hypothetical protein, partial [Gordonia]